MFSLYNVVKQFGKVRAISDLSIEFKPNQTSVLIGSSGCGKSTLLRLLLGLIKPDAGEVRFKGEKIVSFEEVRINTGYVVQDGGLFPHLNSRKNITLVADFQRWEKTRISNRLDNLIELTQFPPEAISRYPAELSGGQRQRVALMRALMLDPEVLLMDEPLVALDPVVRYEMQGELKEIFQVLDKSVIIVTHDISEAAFLGDEIFMMSEGIVLQSGQFQDLQKKPSSEFVTKYLRTQRKF